MKKKKMNQQKIITKKKKTVFKNNFTLKPPTCKLCHRITGTIKYTDYLLFRKLSRRNCTGER